jgi:putative transposase
MALLPRLCLPRIPRHIINAEEYLLVCQRSIELNPVRAGMVSNPEDYSWSSYRVNGLGVTAKMWLPHECYTALGSTPQIRSQTYRELFVSGLENKVVSQIQKASNTGWLWAMTRLNEKLRLWLVGV